MDPFYFILSALATYRISLLFSHERGPWALFERIRAIEYFKRGTSCLLCQSVWWGAMFAILLVIAGEIKPAMAPIYWLAASGLAIIINSQWPIE